jgi:hypothetical protein
MEQIKKSIKNEKGSIIVLAVIMMILATSIFAYVVDLGRIQLARHKAYVAADMASLAGATQIDLDAARSSNPRAILKSPEACRVARNYINKNQFDKGGAGWLGGEGRKIEFNPNDTGSIDSDCYIENAKVPNNLVAMITIRVHYTVKPLVFSNVFNEVDISARSKAVVYLSH